ncbi:MAG: RadC family protein [Clostridia bacterium]|nr:RadC family protein [Clostridia bacterium]
MAQHLHDGHRDRLRQRFEREGGDSFQQHELLELLLFYAIPRRDTNALAHRLLERFHTLDGVFHASVDELTAVEGMGHGAALFLKVVNQMQRARELEQRKTYKCYDTVEKIKEFLVPQFAGLSEEHLYMLMFDSKMRMLDCVLLAKGSVSTLSVNMRSMLKTALDKNAVSVILAHNHPDGVAIPSQQDLLSTSNYTAYFDTFGVTLLQHYVVASGNCTPIIQRHSDYGEMPQL